MRINIGINAHFSGRAWLDAQGGNRPTAENITITGISPIADIGVSSALFSRRGTKDRFATTT